MPRALGSSIPDRAGHWDWSPQRFRARLKAALPCGRPHQRVAAAAPSQAVPTRVLTTGTLSLLPGTGQRVEGCPSWYSRFGAILAQGLAEPRALGHPSPSRGRRVGLCMAV